MIGRLATDASKVSPLYPVAESTDLRIVRRGRGVGDGPPAVWVLTDDKLGHTTQSVGLAEALRWPYVTKELRFNALNRLSNRFLGASALTLNQRRSTPLRPPWPDLVIATGRRTAPIARWIGSKSHGRTRLVQLGRKGADRPDDFDLSVTCAHFALPPHPRRIETLAPLTAIDDQRLSAAGVRWRNLFGSAPHPHVAMLVGGSSALHRLDAETAARMGRELADFTRAAGGSLFVVTSPRTGASAGAALRVATEGIGRFYEWRPGDADNPYLGCLAVADVLVVTGDSESMLAEAAATSTPLYVYPLPDRMIEARQRLRAWVRRQAQQPPVDKRIGRSQLQRLCGRFLELGLVRAPRDLAAMHQDLIVAGRARAFGAPLDIAQCTPLRELDQVAERIRVLFGFSSRTTVE